MKHNREDIGVMIANKRKIPTKMRNKAFGAKLQYAAQNFIGALSVTALKKLALKMHGDMKGDKHKENRDMLARWMYRKDYLVTIRHSDSLGVWLCQRTCLLTWQGEFGLIIKGDYESLLNHLEGLTEALDSNDVCIRLATAFGKVLRQD